MKEAACEELCRFLTRSRYQRWWLFILSALDDGLSIDACCEPPYLQATYFWPQGSFVQIFHCGRRGCVEKARLFRISMTMACRAVAGVGARKILVSTQKRQAAKHARTKYNFFLCRHQTNDITQWMWLPPLIISAILTVLLRLHGKRQGLTQAWLFSWRGWKPSGNEPSKES